MRKIFFLLLLAPAFKIDAQQVVAASKEPLHKVVFENEYLRVLDVHLSPGDTTLFHKHETPSVFISLQPVRTGSEVVMEENSATVLSLDRTITFEGFYKTPRIHRVWNADTSVFHVMDVEVLTKGDNKIATPIAVPGFQQLFDAPPVRTYRVTLTGNKDIEIVRNNGVLIVGLNDAVNVKVNDKSFQKEGDFLFVPPSKKIKLVNKGQNEYSFALLELK